MPPLSLERLAELTGAELRGDPACQVVQVASLDEAQPGQLAFLASKRFVPYLESTRASAVILSADYAPRCPTNALVSDNPQLAYALAAAALNERPRAPAGIHETAVVDPSAEIAASASVGAHCVIGADCVIGENVEIGPNCVVDDACEIGADSRLVASVTLCKGTRLGRRCLIHPGAVLGADGFGLANDRGRWVKIPQLGRVILGDDVEVGACTTIDRGALKDTVLHDGVKLDNQIQVAHNVEIGENTAMAAHVGISGSTRIGSGCTVAGAAGIAGHLELADGVHVSGLTAVSRSLRKPGVYTSTVPAMPHDQWGRNFARLRQLDDLFRRVRALEKILQENNTDAEPK
ncbi:MAG: UDP-3-O-(3-hydroxymyristoyl)glucosamine N-acyltransferase [Gammaproteobacteria bacterium]|nr:MAG: UDP-3-O-(3-hydroxymyristoyl)glucosamine N-acyltransferase [Gammaproteobacteria bacterium]